MRHALKSHPAQRREGDQRRAAGGAMRRRMAPVALAVAVPAALTAAAGGSVLGAAAPAAAAVPSVTAARCTDTWVGKALRPLWTLARNWSNGVPGRSSDVCITLTGAEVSTGVSVKIHSLQLGQADSLTLAGNDAKRVTATVATFVDLTPGGTSLLSMNNATVKAAKIDNQGGTIFTVGACDLDSPDVVLGQGAAMKDASGTTTLQSLPQLSNATLTGASFTTETSDTFFVLPGDITAADHRLAGNRDTRRGSDGDRCQLQRAGHHLPGSRDGHAARDGGGARQWRLLGPGHDPRDGEGRPPPGPPGGWPTLSACRTPAAGEE